MLGPKPLSPRKEPMRTFYHDDPEPQDPKKPYESPFANRLSDFISLQIAAAATLLGYAYLGILFGTILAGVSLLAVVFVFRKAA